MTSLVVDASVLVDAILDEGWETPIDFGLAAAPALIDIEFAAALRKLVMRRTITAGRASRAVRAVVELDGFQRFSHDELLPRVWELRDRITPYDAAYVALAERFGWELLTLDARLARTASDFCATRLL